MAAGVDGIVIDWERDGKRARQLAADTEINEDTELDLLRVREATNALGSRAEAPGTVPR